MTALVAGKELEFLLGTSTAVVLKCTYQACKNSLFYQVWPRRFTHFGYPQDLGELAPGLMFLIDRNIPLITLNVRTPRILNIEFAYHLLLILRAMTRCVHLSVCLRVRNGFEYPLDTQICMLEKYLEAFGGGRKQ